MKYLVSPYLRYGYAFEAKKRNNSLFDYLNDRPYIVSQNELKAIRFCYEPREKEDIVGEFGEQIFNKLKQSHLILEADTIWEQNHAHHIEIETSTICNWRCEYCPVKYNKRIPKYMDLNVFNQIIDRTIEYGHIKYVTLHSYNEPTIDKNFFNYLKKISQTRLMLTLYTNGSGLDETKINILKNYKNLRNIVITIPSVNREKFEEMTGSRDYDKTIRAIRMAKKEGINVRLSIQGLGDLTHKAEIEALKKEFSGLLYSQYMSFDRAGTLKNEYNQNLHVGGDYLYGCRSFMEIIPVNVNGEVFICCNDFYQKNKLGNILDKPISEVLSGRIASKYRREIWGGTKVSSDHICRKCYLMEVGSKEGTVWKEAKGK